MDKALSWFERSIVALLLGVATAPVCAGTRTPAAELAFPAGDGWDEPLAAEPLLAQPAAYSAGDTATAYGSEPRVDEFVQPTQFGIGAALSLQVGLDAQTRLQAGQPKRGTGVAIAGLASIPFMIGDTGAGTCVSFQTIGYLDLDLGHPTLTCSRLNISENNTPLTADRTYLSYRHFANATPIRFFELAETLDIERFTLGFEKTLADGLWSVEMRVPIEYRLRSNQISFFADTDGDFLEPPDIFQANSGRDCEFANLSMIFKRMLVEREKFVMSGGLGLTLPTAQDFTFQGAVFNSFIEFPFSTPPYLVFADYDAGVEIENETVYLAPFLSWAYRPNKRWFHQGFLQIEAAANPSRVTVFDNGSVGLVYEDYLSGFDPVSPDFGAAWTIDGVFGGEASTDLYAQTLLRLNLGFGCFLVDEPRNAYLKQLAAIFEVHYTTPLERARLSTIPLEGVVFTGTETFDIDAFDPQIGNLNSRIDIVNATLGASARIGKTTLTNGFTAPLRGNDNRGFDFEYNLQVQREF